MSTEATTAEDTPKRKPTAGARESTWLAWCTAFGTTAIMIAGHWDVAWHRSIGRDALLSPPHSLLYFGAIFSGVAAGISILRATLGRESARRCVRMWGFWGPLGAFVSVWGCLAMLASAPFDNWWHTAYGIDVVVLSPPHSVLFLGILAVAVGTLLLARWSARRREIIGKTDAGLVLYAGGMLLVFELLFITEFTANYFLHTARCYLVLGLAVPPLLTAVARTSEKKWACSIVAGVYTVVGLLLEWILPLFPAEPKLGPVLHRVTHLIPPSFPILLIAPAIVMDVVLRKTARRDPWLGAIVVGTSFMLTLLAVEWPFATFLHSGRADNWFFGAHYFGYYISERSYAFRRVFWPLEPTQSSFFIMMALALAASCATTRLGLALGSRLRLLWR